MTDTPAPHADTPVMLSQPQVEDVFAATEEVRKCDKIRRISIAPLIGEALRRINNEASVSSLFD